MQFLQGLIVSGLVGQVPSSACADVGGGGVDDGQGQEAEM